jgi:hypothetical protein
VLVLQLPGGGEGKGGMAETATSKQSLRDSADSGGRSETGAIAKWVLIVSGTGIALTAVCTIVASTTVGDANSIRETSQAVFNALLPLFGTWVGTVLAYYFSKQNFTAASESVQRMAELTSDQKLVSYSVESKMIPANQITTFQIPAGKAPKDVLLGDLRTRYGGKITRLPITDSAGVVMYIVHQSMLFRFIADKVLTKSGADVTKLTLQDLIDDAETKSNVTNIAYGPVKTTVAFAKAAMDQQRGCQDFIVTQTGQKTEPMLGWLTNVDIGQLSKA